jgi:glycosyltransferase involved in cell wall biosynthesis
MGRRELSAWVPRCDLALGDSEFNRQELEAVGFPRTAVLPVVPDFSHLDGEPDPFVARDFDDGWTNVLFVGRIVPNKRIDQLIRIFHAYKTGFNPRSRLIVVGAHGGFEKYLAMLHQLVARLGTSDVHLTGQVSDAELIAYYDVADLFLSASEHEGFCVPLVEAFYNRLPVVAYASTAVPATMDGAGVLYEDRDPAHVAAIVDAVVADTTLYEAILEGQDAALGRLRGRDFAGTLLVFVDQTLHAPRQARWEVSFDFWDQFRSYEALKELQEYRPAIFRALRVRAVEGVPNPDPRGLDCK